ncbi:hypothetical protein LWC34_12610 [Kibdelosporangium philippinense]|uniref:Uncharacterized protein n=1 Tax=Kibdelosporangium philippinense TaxID=211113 RepID=A0ABS8Z6Z9_9PSEU|nr:hypothetical protein [Kibdelosporangium philippinense]MCE7003661.1 hypothetical protein [Kibdelosporangium philippinense]
MDLGQVRVRRPGGRWLSERLRLRGGDPINKIDLDGRSLWGWITKNATAISNVLSTAAVVLSVAAMFVPVLARSPSWSTSRRSHGDWFGVVTSLPGIEAAATRG